jgi:hypothetical protein
MIRSQRGGTLIEAMIAMMVMLIGAAAMTGLHRQALYFNGDGRKLTRASAMAADLLANLERLDYNDPLLGNANTGNDADIADSRFDLEGGSVSPSSVTDHGWSELPTSWPGVTSASAIAGATALGATGLELYWNVRETVGPTYSYKQIAAIVRWSHGQGWRRLVVVGVKPGAAYVP